MIDPNAIRPSWRRSRAIPGARHTIRRPAYQGPSGRRRNASAAATVIISSFSRLNLAACTIRSHANRFAISQIDRAHTVPSYALDHGSEPRPHFDLVLQHEWLLPQAEVLRNRQPPHPESGRNDPDQKANSQPLRRKLQTAKSAGLTRSQSGSTRVRSA